LTDQIYATLLVREPGESLDAASVCLPPWLENPYRLVSLWDMERFSAENLHTALALLENLRNRCANAQPLGDAHVARLFGQQRFLVSDERQAIESQLAAIEAWLCNSGLRTSSEALKDLRETVGAVEAIPKLAASIVGHDLEELQKTIQREMRTVLFLYVPAKDATLYTEPLAEWEFVAKRWPQTRTNISESSLCLAFNRYGGAVFHILLVAEFGAIQVGNLMKASGDRPGWGCVARLEEILTRKYPNRSDIEQHHSDLLREMVPKMVSLRNARHRITHADNSDAWLVQDIGPNTADEIIKSTRGFMRELAVRLAAVP
jgi:hypothetical protein